jgi:hypothetical protein
MQFKTLNPILSFHENGNLLTLIKKDSRFRGNDSEYWLIKQPLYIKCKFYLSLNPNIMATQPLTTSSALLPEG